MNFTTTTRNVNSLVWNPLLNEMGGNNYRIMGFKINFSQARRFSSLTSRALSLNSHMSMTKSCLWNIWNAIKEDMNIHFLYSLEIKWSLPFFHKKTNWNFFQMKDLRGRIHQISYHTFPRPYFLYTWNMMRFIQIQITFYIRA